MYTLQLVNRDYPLASHFVPSHLTQDKQSRIWVCKVALKAFRALNKGLEKKGLSSLFLISGYRPYAYQERLFERKKQVFLKQGLDDKAAYNKASQIIAPPGCSEHQLGLAIDVATWSMKDLEDPLIISFGETKEGCWLQNYAPYYGFILRYPLDKTTITGVSYEPWHYRYVGKEHALTMQKRQFTLEEYTNFLKKESF
ncbi:hypothetical protein CS063_08965 [Sporanaerobium hydrogeniformans]|uniref:Uncharacterized protein n=1 Tax=Sporanaerobium hydrogeniformans TaxID=3072179 RepID=A0AC61DDK8_9FIRM|nr:M15 family metallopeptidase [Sporanaerobium hydrogeniformans]PHV70652.1 hypothetical protein CS063_08965 [Sporanaerobium hydrogeniformans]